MKSIVGSRTKMLRICYRFQRVKHAQFFYFSQPKLICNSFPDQGKIPLAMITTMKKLKSGYINGTRVSLGNLNDFLSTSCITNLSFLGSSEDGRPDKLNPQVHVI